MSFQLKGTLALLGANTAKDLVPWARKYGYGAEIIDLLAAYGDEEKETTYKSKHAAAYNKLVHSLKKKENGRQRTALEWGADLIADWIVEDALRESLRKGGINITLNDTDAERSFLDRERKSCKADFLLHFDKETVPVELITDYCGYWSQKGWADLRSDKCAHLTAQHAVLLGLDILNRQFFACRINDLHAGRPVFNAAWGCKSHSVLLPPLVWQKMHSGAIAAELRKLKKSC